MQGTRHAVHNEAKAYSNNRITVLEDHFTLTICEN